MRFTQLQCKEVICVATGQRLGFITDVVVEIPCGQVQAVVVPCPGKCFGLLGKQEDYRIPWSAIVRIGPDIVLVDTEPDKCRCPRPRNGV